MHESRGSATRTRGSRTSAVALALAALIAGAVPAVAAPAAKETAKAPGFNPEQRAAALARPAVVFVQVAYTGYVWDHDGDLLNFGEPFQWAGRCTGFIVNPEGYIVTAGHCVDDGIGGGKGKLIAKGVSFWIEQGWIDESQADALYEIGMANWRVEGASAGSPPDRQVQVYYGVATSGLTTGTGWPARVIEFSTVDDGDVALLKVEQRNTPSIVLAPSTEIEVGTKVLSIGYPGSTDMVTDETLEPTNKSGEVSAKKTRGSVPFYEISAATSGGMSGGPTVDMDGRVVGLVSFSPASEVQAFNFISPSSLIAETLTRNGVKNELGRLDKVYREGLERYLDGNYTAAIARFDEVLAVVPSHQQAQEYKSKAAEQRQLTGDLVKPVAPKKESGGGLPVLVLVGVALGLLVLAGGGAALGLRARRGRGAPAPVAPWPGSVPPSWSMEAPPAPAMVPEQDGAGTSRGGVAVALPTRTGVESCAACGAQNAADARFCSGCGAAQ